MSVADESKKPFVIAIANEKGGVGKTTSTLAIGTILAKLGHKVLFIDLDPQGNLTLALGFKPHDMPSPSYGLPTAGTLFAKDSYKTETENLDLIFARSLIVDEEHQMQVNTGDDLYYLSQDLDVISTLPYDYVVIDCPPTMGKVAISTLLVSDYLVIPSQADFFSAYALKNMMELIGVVRQEGNPGLPYRILVTLFDRRNRIHHIIRNQLSQTFGEGFFKTIIEVDTQMRKMAILGFPTRTSRGVKQYRKLVYELMEDIQKLQTT
jgi:chromosome partitioning protein